MIFQILGIFRHGAQNGSLAEVAPHIAASLHQYDGIMDHEGRTSVGGPVGQRQRLGGHRGSASRGRRGGSAGGASNNGGGDAGNDE